MSDKKVWLVTGAGRGLGVDIAKAALAMSTPRPRPAPVTNQTFLSLMLLHFLLLGSC